MDELTKAILAKFSEEDVKALQDAVKADLEKPIEDWSEQDREDYVAMGYKLPRTRKVND